MFEASFTGSEVTAAILMIALPLQYLTIFLTYTSENACKQGLGVDDAVGNVASYFYTRNSGGNTVRVFSWWLLSRRLIVQSLHVCKCIVV